MTNDTDTAKTVLADAASEATHVVDSAAAAALVVVEVAASDARLLLAKALDHEARISVLERKSDVRVGVISSVTSVLVAVIAAVMSGCFVPAQVPAPTPDQVVHVRHSVVYVQGHDVFGPAYSATGFFISDDKVVTAGHACFPGVRMTVTTEDGTVVRAQPILDVDDPDATTGNDVCILATPGYTNGTHLSLAPHSPPLGSHIWTLGYPYGEVLAPSDGYLGEPALSLPAYTGTTLVGTHGNSGGPVMNDQSDVIGIVSLGVDPIMLLVPLEVLRLDIGAVQ